MHPSSELELELDFRFKYLKNLNLINMVTVFSYVGFLGGFLAVTITVYLALLKIKLI